MERLPINDNETRGVTGAPRDEDMQRERYYKGVRRRSETSASRYNLPYPVEKVNSIDWDAPEYAITPNDPRWVLPPKFDIGATEWYQNLPQEEQIKIGMARIAQVIMTGAQFEMALNMGIFSANMDPKRNFTDKRYSHHEAVEEGHHIMMFMELLNRMQPAMESMGAEIQGAPEWFVATAPIVTVISRRLPLGFWQVVLSGEEPIDRMQRALRDHDKSLEKQEIEEGRIHPLLRKVMDVHIEEEAGHIGYAADLMKKQLKVSEEDKEAGKDKLGPVARLALAVGKPAVYRAFAEVILHPDKKSREAMGIPDEVAKEVWWQSDQAQETFQGFFKNARRRADEEGLRNGEVKNRIGGIAWRLFGIDGKEDTPRGKKKLFSSLRKSR